MSSPEPPEDSAEEVHADRGAALAAELLMFTAPPLGAARAWLVRGVLPLPTETAAARVVLWDGVKPGSSRAFDLPLGDPEGAGVSPDTLIAALRFLVDEGRDDPVAAVGRDPLGIPLGDAGTVVRALAAARFTVGDALRAAGGALAPRAGESGLRLRGYLLAGRDTVRLYLDRPGADLAPVGVDAPVYREGGEVIPGMTGLAAALPDLIPDDLPFHRASVTDPYCTDVYDFTRW